MKGGPAWNRLAAATGIGFALAIAASGIVMQAKDLHFAGDSVTASNEVFGSITMLTGVAVVFFFWFTGTLAARLRQLEGGSGRLAAVVNGSGAIIAGSLGLGIAALFAARNGGGSDLAGLATGIFDGPTLLFPAAAYVGAAGLVGIRSDGLPTPSRIVALLSVPLGASYIAMAGLQIFKDYAWINDTAYITFVVWVLLLSNIGVQRWGDMDERAPSAAAAPAPRAVPAPVPALDDDEDDEPAPRPRKPAARKTTAKKKAPARKR